MGELMLLFRRDGVAAVNKPSGLATVPARGEPPENCLHAAAQQQLQCRLWVVHRLDRETSGVILFAENPDAHRSLSLAFERRLILKEYLAFTSGVPSPSRGVINTPLHAARRGKMRPALPGEGGDQDAVTEYEVLGSAAIGGSPAAAVLCRPLTGRQHQIRVHMRSIGAPLLGDTLYGKAAARHQTGTPLELKRLALHAWRLTIPTGCPGGPAIIEAPLPGGLLPLARLLLDDGGEQ
ncbi:MAG: Ribosomal large subunit pseudouridine synthase A [Myxococcota bacterium]|nr:Ribosomal large subunit pseudouridine synthase A [Myxococcota bacterium]